MITNVIDRRKRPYRWGKINAVIEPTAHDNSVPDSDDIRLAAPDWIGYDEREHTSVAGALEWAQKHREFVTLYLYDEDGGIYEQPSPDGAPIKQVSK